MNDAQLVRVHSFMLYDEHSEQVNVALFQATRERILLLGGRVIEGAVRWVSPDELDAHGHFRRVATGWGDLSRTAQGAPTA